MLAACTTRRSASSGELADVSSPLPHLHRIRLELLLLLGEPLATRPEVLVLLGAFDHLLAGGVRELVELPGLERRRERLARRARHAHRLDHAAHGVVLQAAEGGRGSSEGVWCHRHLRPRTAAQPVQGECGIVSICKHGRQRSLCKEFGGSGICEHGRQRSHMECAAVAASLSTGGSAASASSAMAAACSKVNATMAVLVTVLRTILWSW